MAQEHFYYYLQDEQYWCLVKCPHIGAARIFAAGGVHFIFTSKADDLLVISLVYRLIS